MLKVSRNTCGAFVVGVTFGVVEPEKGSSITFVGPQKPLPVWTVPEFCQCQTLGLLGVRSSQGLEVASSLFREFLHFG